MIRSSTLARATSYEGQKAGRPEGQKATSRSTDPSPAEAVDDIGAVLQVFLNLLALVEDRAVRAVFQGAAETGKRTEQK